MANIFGKIGVDTLDGTPGDDFIFGYAEGDPTDTAGDNLNGQDGSDTVYGGKGDDTLHGNGGNDILYGGNGADFLYGDDGDDTLVGNDDPFAFESDTLSGGAGNDTIMGELSDIIDGGPGNDALYAVNSYGWSFDLGAASIEIMVSAFGDDTLNAATLGTGAVIDASGGNDTVTGSAFNDYLWAGVGNDYLYGGGGDDVLFGDLGADHLFGEGGNDTIYFDGDDGFDGGDGTDVLYITGGTGQNLNLTQTSIEWVSDYVGGMDNIDAAASSAAITVFAGNGFDTVKGGSGDDYLWGQDGADTLTGNAGADNLIGGAGGDDLEGGLGNDNIFAGDGTGGDGGIDIIRYTSAGWGTDFIYDFEHGLDKLDMRGSGATAGGIGITDIGGSAHVAFGADLIVVVGAGASLTISDILFS